MKNILSFIGILLVIFSSCTFWDNKEKQITDEDIAKYIKVYKNLREKAPEFLEKANKNPNNLNIGTEQFNNFEQIIKDGGFKGYADFVLMNAKIGSIFSIIQGSKGMDMFKNLTESGSEQLTEAQKALEEKIADTNISEDIKSGYKKSLEEINQAREKISVEWQKNKEWADYVLEKSKKISGFIVSDQDIAVVAKYEKEIMEAYAGFQMPELPEGKFPDIKIE